MIVVRKDAQSDLQISTPFKGSAGQRKSLMVRLRFAVLAGAAGMVLLCGCNSLSHHSLLGRRNTCTGPECCGGGIVADQEGPIVDAGNVPVIPGAPGGPTGIYGPGPLPPNSVPQLNPAPRLVPQPQQSPTMPYTPP